VRTGGVIIRGLRAGAKLIQQEAKRRAPVGTALRAVGRGRKRKDGTRSEPRQVRGGLLRANIVQHPIPTGSRVAAGNPTVIIRVRNRGYTRVNGKLRINRPGSAPGYWWLQEFGTSRTPARRFMRGAFEAKKEDAAREIKRAMQDEIARLFGQHFKAAA
jgi:HK97 gp10 family phage protein